MQGRIFNIQKFSLHDGPGIRTTVFFKGCPLACEWCSNPESQNEEPEIVVNKNRCIKCHSCEKLAPESVTFNDYPEFNRKSLDLGDQLIRNCPQKALTLEGEYRDVEEIVKVCLQDKDFYEESGGGVTISGGEGMSQPEFLKELVEKLKKNRIDLAIETTGHVDSDVFQELAPFFDHLLMDFKHYDSQRHKEGTGEDNEQILENLSWAVQNHPDLLVRIPVIPDFNDSLEDAENFALILDDYGVKRVQLLPFHQFGESKYEKMGRDYKYRDIPSYHPEDLAEFRDILIENGIDCFI